MRPPQHILKALHKINPTLRLGWMHVEDYVSEDFGCFVLLQLIPVAGVSKTFRECWVDRGPVYGSPYHTDMQIPQLMGTFSAPQVYTGDFLVEVRSWHQDVQKAIKESRLQKARDMDYHMAEMAGERAETLMWGSRNSPDRSTVVANKHLTTKEKKILDGDFKTYEDQAKEQIGSL
jgi:hypothetical protein